MGMGSHPDWEWVERPQFSGSVELPATHAEHLEHRDGLTLGEVAHALFHDGLHFGDGLRAEWRRLTGGEAEESRFVQAYADYLSAPVDMRRADPDGFAFLRDRVFHGREYGPPPVRFGYLDHDSQGRQVEVTGNGTWVVASGEKIA